MQIDNVSSDVTGVSSLTILDTVAPANGTARSVAQTLPSLGEDPREKIANALAADDRREH